MTRIVGTLALITCGFFSCSSPDQPSQPQDKPKATPPLELERGVLKDKVLGMLVGSAIGDAMGAPTEMWNRSDIQLHHGFVTDLDTMVRAPSAEGTWDYNLPAGGTTDDTRWKFLVGEFLIQGGADDVDFSRFVLRRYQEKLKALKSTQGFDPESYESGLREMAWLQEWALVAKPYAAGDLAGYSYALNRFYGGEMTCAGMLYSPMVGIMYPNSPEKAYEEAYRLSIFDLGYARDISALTASMVSVAMAPKPESSELFRVLRDVDPNNYFRSRLVGRSSYRVFQDVRRIVDQANRVTLDDLDLGSFNLPIGPDSDTLFLLKCQKAYTLLDQRLRELPFHPAEIHMINLTALLLCDLDFRKSLSFVTNFGRDNDTVAAVTGAILGAYWGVDKLPAQMVERVLLVNRNLGLDLEILAERLTEKILTYHSE